MHSNYLVYYFHQAADRYISIENIKDVLFAAYIHSSNEIQLQYNMAPIISGLSRPLNHVEPLSWTPFIIHLCQRNDNVKVQ